MNCKYKINNLVFSGGGVLGIAFLGVLDFLHEHMILQNIKRAAGTSAGAITACITSFNLPFPEIKKIADTLDYRKIPQKTDRPKISNIPDVYVKSFEDIFGDIDCLYRLINNYGWYSSEYFYEWMKEHIAAQFDSTKKLPPYTFEDFKNNNIHKNQRPFLDLYVIGVDVSNKCSKVFSYETTPNMEVAEAVRISMSIPLYFEQIEITDNKQTSSIYSDGGVMRIYPINIFDYDFYDDVTIKNINMQTLGARFESKIEYNEIDNFLDYIENLLKSILRVQQDIFDNSPEDKARSINIYTDNISSTDFDISLNDKKYTFLYQQGYNAAKNYFKKSLH